MRILLVVASVALAMCANDTCATANTGDDVEDDFSSQLQTTKFQKVTPESSSDKLSAALAQRMAAKGKLGLEAHSDVDRTVQPKDKRPPPQNRVTESFIKINGVKYSRIKANDAILGRIGRKGDRQGLVDWSQMGPESWLKDNVMANFTYEIDSSFENELSMSLQAKWDSAKFSAHSDATLDIDKSSASGKLVLQRLEIQDSGKILNWLNYGQEEENFDVRKINYLLAMGDKGRICRTIWVLREDNQGSYSNCVKGGARMNLTVSSGGLGGKIEGSHCGKNTYKFSKGAIMAYEAAYLHVEQRCFDKETGLIQPVGSCIDKETGLILPGHEKKNWYKLITEHW